MATSKAGRKPLTPAEKEARKNALKSESPSARFVRVAKVRVPKAVSSLNAVANLTARGYEFTEEQRDKVIAAIETATADAVRTLKAGKRSSATFDL